MEYYLVLEDIAPEEADEMNQNIIVESRQTILERFSEKHSSDRAKEII